jgi:hypothetical protein
MASNNGGLTYKLSLLHTAHETLQDLKRIALSRGCGDRFAADLEAVVRLLKQAPTRWGDPLFDYKQLGMTRRRGRSECLFVYYSVHEAGQVVFVQDITANPFGPLA